MLKRMDRVLEERVDELADEICTRTGLTPSVAKRFVRVAAPDILASYRWQRDDRSTSERPSSPSAREVLAGISCGALASKVGLSTRRTLACLQVLVGSVLEAVDRPTRSNVTRQPAVSLAALPRRSEKRDPEGSARGGTTETTPRRFDVGFGLFFESGVEEDLPGAEPEGARPMSLRHPIFGSLFPVPDR